MSVFTTPEDRARETAAWIRRHEGLSHDTIALLEQAAEREWRQLRIVRQLLFLCYVLPLLLVAGAVLLVATGIVPFP